MKKIIIGLGTISAIAMPTVLVVSCGDEPTFGEVRMIVSDTHGINPYIGENDRELFIDVWDGERWYDCLSTDNILDGWLFDKDIANSILDDILVKLETLDDNITYYFSPDPYTKDQLIEVGKLFKSMFEHMESVIDSTTFVYWKGEGEVRDMDSDGIILDASDPNILRYDFDWKNAVLNTDGLSEELRAAEIEKMYKMFAIFENTEYTVVAETGWSDGVITYTEEPESIDGEKRRLIGRIFHILKSDAQIV